MRTVRNVAIVAALAAAVDFLPGGGRAANTISSLLGVAFAVLIGLILVRFYRDHRLDIDGLGDRWRALLYGALGVGLVVLAAAPRLWATGLGELVWFVIMGLVAWTFVSVFRHYRTL